MPTFTQNLPPEIAAQYDAIARRQAVNDALMQRSLQTPTTQSTGGKYARAVPYSPIQGGLNMVQAALAKRQQDRNQKALSDLATQYQEEQQRRVEELERRRMGEAPWASPDATGAALAATTDPYVSSTGYADYVSGLGRGDRGAYSQLTQAWNPDTKELENVIVDTRGIPGQNVFRLGGERYDQPFISAKDPRVSAEKKKQEALAEREAEKIIAKPRTEARIEAEQFKLENLDTTVDKAIDQAEGFGATAVGAQLTSWIGGTPAGDLAGTLATLEAEAGFGRLQEMRDSAPTGGALGQVSERELQLLTAAFQSLKQNQSKPQLIDNLNKFKGLYKESWRRINEAYKKDYGEYYMNPDSFKSKKAKPKADDPIEDILKFLEAE